MNKEIKEKWVQALRSGEYKKGKGQLKREGGKETLYCCLGVLTDLYIKETGRKGGWDNKAGFGEYGASLPHKVMKWAGLKQTDPIVPYVGTVRGVRKVEATLSLINDVTRNSFKDIAGIIEKSL